MIQVPQKPEEALKVYMAAHCFGRFAETSALFEHLRAELHRHDVLNRSEQDMTVLKQRQGACQVLEGILAMIEQADEKVSKIKENLSRKGA